MNTAIRVFAIITGVIAGVFLFFLGFEWLYIGFGLNPWLAFPLGLISCTLPSAVVIWESNQY